MPELLYLDRSAGALVMRYLDPGRFRLWKTLLRDGQAEPASAAAVGMRLASIHRATAHDAEVAARFPTDRIFHEIRLEPYLLATAERHPDLEPALRRLARRTATTKLALVHGDVSPKNILIGPDGPGVPRRRMRLVRRSGLRPRLLPQPPAAEVPMDAGGGARLPRLLRRAGRRAISRASSGSRGAGSRPAPRPCCRGCSWPGSTASRRSST